ncbi:MAG: hypothetical protein M1450_01420 [Patescibacteria group bacterium]|nr:hypothetical protein [Patescibacteria group bacterium]
MEIIYPPALITCLKNKHLILDTTVFRDAAVKPTVFENFFNKLKEANIVLTTNDFVKFELLKGSSDSSKYKAKEKVINDIIDVSLPVLSQTCELVYDLIEDYGIDGTSLSITDLTLGATLMQYKENIYLMTRDTTDFIQKIFHLVFVINAPHPKGIFTYGVYQYLKK